MTQPDELDHVTPDRRPLLDARIVMLSNEVGDDSADAVIAQLLALSADDPESDICLFVNSPGGSVLAGLAVYDASSAALLLAAGAHGKRAVLEHALVLSGRAAVDYGVADLVPERMGSGRRELEARTALRPGVDAEAVG